MRKIKYADIGYQKMPAFTPGWLLVIYAMRGLIGKYWRNAGTWQ